MQGVSPKGGTPFSALKNTFGGNPMKKFLTMLLCFVMALSCVFGVAACAPADDKGNTGAVTPGGDQPGGTEQPGGDQPGGSEQPGGDEQDPSGEETPEPALPASEGLEFELNSDKTSYAVVGISCCTDTNVIIPSQYNSLPVTRISYQAFNYCNSLTSIVIPDSVTSIGDWAFMDCSNLTTVYYTGSEAEWEQIDFGSWNDELLNAEIVFNYKGE